MDAMAIDMTLTTAAKASQHVHVRPQDPQFAWFLLVIVVLVLFGGVFAGLTLGLMGLDNVNLQVLSIAGTPAERRQAPKVLALLNSGRHTMLVVLLLGELPQKSPICNRFGLAIGAGFAPLVRVLVIIMYPIAKPIGMVLDYFLGQHDAGTTYRKAELKTFVSLGVEDQLGEEEVAILGSVLEFSGKTVKDIMTKNENVYVLSAEKIMDEEIVAEILHKGFSRIPVHEHTNSKAFLIRGLVGYDPTDLRPASTLITQILPQCPPDLSLLEAMAYFQTGRSHILLVSATPGKGEGAMGVVTLEDVVEELIGKEIIDETDRYIDAESRIQVVRPRPQSEGLKIIEGRLARRKLVLAGRREGRDERDVVTGHLIDHPSLA
ncbi:metal transporter CNNM, partial [Tremellales sp. Uapishka_1]